VTQQRRLSDHCIVDHTAEELSGQLTLRERLLGPMFMVDRLMHFTGVRGRLWSLLGVRRSNKNPNVCNI
jgi:uncharacterized membrane protein YecN with MAPEG domain